MQGKNGMEIKDGLLIEQADSEAGKIQAWGCKCRRFNNC